MHSATCALKYCSNFYQNGLEFLTSILLVLVFFHCYIYFKLLLILVLISPKFYPISGQGMVLHTRLFQTFNMFTLFQIRTSKPCFSLCPLSDRIKTGTGTSKLWCRENLYVIVFFVTFEFAHFKMLQVTIFINAGLTERNIYSTMKKMNIICRRPSSC